MLSAQNFPSGADRLQFIKTRAARQIEEKSRGRESKTVPPDSDNLFFQFLSRSLSSFDKAKDMTGDMAARVRDAVKDMPQVAVKDMPQAENLALDAARDRDMARDTDMAADVDMAGDMDMIRDGDIAVDVDMARSVKTSGEVNTDGEVAVTRDSDMTGKMNVAQAGYFMRDAGEVAQNRYWAGDTFRAQAIARDMVQSQDTRGRGIARYRAQDRIGKNGIGRITLVESEADKIYIKRIIPYHWSTVRIDFENVRPLQAQQEGEPGPAVVNKGSADTDIGSGKDTRSLPGETPLHPGESQGSHEGIREGFQPPPVRIQSFSGVTQPDPEVTQSLSRGHQYLPFIEEDLKPLWRREPLWLEHTASPLPSEGNAIQLSPAIHESGYVEPSARKMTIPSSSLHEKESGVVPPQSKGLPHTVGAAAEGSGQTPAFVRETEEGDLIYHPYSASPLTDNVINLALRTAKPLTTTLSPQGRGGKETALGSMTALDLMTSPFEGERDDSLAPGGKVDNEVIAMREEYDRSFPNEDVDSLSVIEGDDHGESLPPLEVVRGSIIEGEGNHSEYFAEPARQSTLDPQAEPEKSPLNPELISGPQNRYRVDWQAVPNGQGKLSSDAASARQDKLNMKAEPDQNGKLNLEPVFVPRAQAQDEVEPVPVMQDKFRIQAEPDQKGKFSSEPVPGQRVQNGINWQAEPDGQSKFSFDAEPVKHGEYTLQVDSDQNGEFSPATVPPGPQAQEPDGVTWQAESPDGQSKLNPEAASAQQSMFTPQAETEQMGELNQEPVTVLQGQDRINWQIAPDGQDKASLEVASARQDKLNMKAEEPDGRGTMSPEAVSIRQGMFNPQAEPDQKDKPNPEPVLRPLDQNGITGQVEPDEQSRLRLEAASARQDEVGMKTEPDQKGKFSLAEPAPGPQARSQDQDQGQVTWQSEPDGQDKLGLEAAPAQRSPFNPQVELSQKGKLNSEPVPGPQDQNEINWQAWPDEQAKLRPEAASAQQSMFTPQAETEQRGELNQEAVTVLQEQDRINWQIIAPDGQGNQSLGGASAMQDELKVKVELDHKGKLNPEPALRQQGQEQDRVIWDAVTEGQGKLGLEAASVKQDEHTPDVPHFPFFNEKGENSHHPHPASPLKGEESDGGLPATGAPPLKGEEYERGTSPRWGTSEHTLQAETEQRVELNPEPVSAPQAQAQDRVTWQAESDGQSRLSPGTISARQDELNPQAETEQKGELNPEPVSAPQAQERDRVIWQAEPDSQGKLSPEVEVVFAQRSMFNPQAEPDQKGELNPEPIPVSQAQEQKGEEVKIIWQAIPDEQGKVGLETVSVKQNEFTLKIEPHQKDDFNPEPVPGLQAQDSEPVPGPQDQNEINWQAWPDEQAKLRPEAASAQQSMFTPQAETEQRGELNQEAVTVLQEQDRINWQIIAPDGQGNQSLGGASAMQDELKVKVELDHKGELNPEPVPAPQAQAQDRVTWQAEPDSQGKLSPEVEVVFAQRSMFNPQAEPDQKGELNPEPIPVPQAQEQKGEEVKIIWQAIPDEQGKVGLEAVSVKQNELTLKIEPHQKDDFNPEPVPGLQAQDQAQDQDRVIWQAEPDGQGKPGMEAAPTQQSMFNPQAEPDQKGKPNLETASARQDKLDPQAEHDPKGKLNPEPVPEQQYQGQDRINWQAEPDGAGKPGLEAASVRQDEFNMKVEPDPKGEPILESVPEPQGQNRVNWLAGPDEQGALSLDAASARQDELNMNRGPDPKDERKPGLVPAPQDNLNQQAEPALSTDLNSWEDLNLPESFDPQPKFDLPVESDPDLQGKIDPQDKQRLIDLRVIQETVNPRTIDPQGRQREIDQQSDKLQSIQGETDRHSKPQDADPRREKADIDPQVMQKEGNLQGTQRVIDPQGTRQDIDPLGKQQVIGPHIVQGITDPEGNREEIGFQDRKGGDADHQSRQRAVDFQAQQQAGNLQGKQQDTDPKAIPKALQGDVDLQGKLTRQVDLNPPQNWQSQTQPVKPGSKSSSAQQGDEKNVLPISSKEQPGSGISVSSPPHPFAAPPSKEVDVPAISRSLTGLVEKQSTPYHDKPKSGPLTSPDSKEAAFSLKLPGQPSLRESTSLPAAINTSTSAASSPVEEIIQQVMPRLTAHIRDNGHSLTVNLHPEHLGRLHISLELKENMFRAHLAADNPQTQKILEENLASLKVSLARHLADQGLEVNQFSVSVGGGGIGHQKQSRFSGYPEGQYQKRREQGLAGISAADTPGSPFGQNGKHDTGDNEINYLA
ncbi:MAG: flagellar hook-length control protein FliK [bacterium]